MFKVNFAITLRSLLQRRGSSVTNGIGLTMRMVVAVLISWWLCSELSYSECNERYDWLASFLRARIIDENFRALLDKVLHLLNYMGDKHGYNLEQVVLADWLVGRLISNCLESCWRGRLQLNGLS